MRTLCLLILLAGISAPATGAELRPETVAAFDAYVRTAEARMAIARNADRRITATEGSTTEVPGGLVHNWRGAIVVKGATVDEAVALLQDYDRHAEIYAPAVARSALLSRSGDTFRVHLRFMMTKVITVVVNSEHEAQFTREGPGRVRSRIVSTRIAEVENPGTRDEREKPVGQDGGYLWRLNTYWRFIEQPGGVYIECESITLTRGIPTGFGWLIRPFTGSIPRESLSFTLATTRRYLEDH